MSTKRTVVLVLAILAAIVAYDIHCIRKIKPKGCVNCYWVDEERGDDTGDGSQVHPWKHIPGVLDCTDKCREFRPTERYTVVIHPVGWGRDQLAITCYDPSLGSLMEGAANGNCNVEQRAGQDAFHHE